MFWCGFSWGCVSSSEPYDQTSPYPIIITGLAVVLCRPSICGSTGTSCFLYNIVWKFAICVTRSYCYQIPTTCLYMWLWIEEPFPLSVSLMYRFSQFYWQGESSSCGTPNGGPLFFFSIILVWSIRGSFPPAWLRWVAYFFDHTVTEAFPISCGYFWP